MGAVIAEIRNKFLSTPKVNANKLKEQSNFYSQAEESQILKDLTLTVPEEETTIEPRKYSVEKLNPKFSNSDAEQMVFEYIQQVKNLEFEKVLGTKSWSGIRYVPKWLVKFNTKSNVYKREILATSGKTITDETLVCQSDFHSNQATYSVDRKRGICEVCGKIFCRFHIFRNNGSYVCEQHQKKSS